ncbi:hypothetical protein GCM10008929_14400 [Alkalibacterium psychrotolerans]
MISSFYKKVIWGSFAMGSPVLFYLAYSLSHTRPDFFSFEFGIFLLLAIIVALYPIHTEESILFLITGISLPAFVLFGLFAEMVLTTIALIFLMMRSHIKLDESFRYPLNIVMFQILSIIAAVTYNLINPYITISSYHNYSIIAMTIYMLIHLLANQFLMLVFNRYLFNDKEASFLDGEFIFSLVTSLFTVPLSFILIYLFVEIGIPGALIGSLPFITITIGVNVHYKSKVNNSYLKKVNTLAQELTEKKQTREVLETYLRSLAMIFPVDALSYFTINDKQSLQRVAIYRKKEGFKELEEAFDLSNKSILKRAMDTKDILYYNRSLDWKKYCIRDLSYTAESALVLPITQQNDVTGLILLSHRTKHMYNEMLVSLIRILHKYFAIALDNAVQYELLEENSETDFLTGLPNLKYFAKKLEYAMSKGVDHISLVVMDLDHFKKTNDQYGHQAGNEILKQVGCLLEDYSNDEITVARFGGEEFVALLPNYTKEEAADVSEDMRRSIEQRVFEISQTIQDKDTVGIKLTASFGVATYPDDCKESDELINLADKAMYIGSKQRGRNRVTLVQEGSLKNAVKKKY